VLWKKRFPEARVIGYDIAIGELHPLAAIMNTNGEIELKQADAYDKSILSLMPGEIDLLIDDGPHTLHSQALALNQFNKLSKNGTIVVEDIAHGIVDIRKLLASLPVDIRKKCEWVTFSHQTGRFDDTLIIFSNSVEVLNYVRQLRRSINGFCLHSPTTFYIYRTWFKLMVLLGVRKYK
jgi:hypothetical protein